MYVESRGIPAVEDDDGWFLLMNDVDAKVQIIDDDDDDATVAAAKLINKILISINNGWRKDRNGKVPALILHANPSRPTAPTMSIFGFTEYLVRRT